MGELVTVTAIVVGDFQTGDADTTRDLRGFFLQEETSDQDGDAATSEGIFVFDPDLIADVSTGDRVTVTGTVNEFNEFTQISADAVEIVEAGAVDVATLAQSFSLDANEGTIGSSGDYTADLEAYEGMYVTFTDTLVVNEMFQLARFGEVRVTVDERPLTYTQFAEPDAAGFDAYLRRDGGRPDHLRRRPERQQPRRARRGRSERRRRVRHVGRLHDGRFRHERHRRHRLLRSASTACAPPSTGVNAFERYRHPRG